MKSYIGYSTDSLMRMKAASGGVGSAIVKYLLDNGKCDYALSFDWDMENLCYQPSMAIRFFSGIFFSRAFLGTVNVRTPCL